MDWPALDHLPADVRDRVRWAAAAMASALECEIVDVAARVREDPRGCEAAYRRWCYTAGYRAGCARDLRLLVAHLPAGPGA